MRQKLRRRAGERRDGLHVTPAGDSLGDSLGDSKQRVDCEVGGVNMPVPCFRESKASDVLDHLIAHQDAWPFEEPVDMDEVRILSSIPSLLSILSFLPSCLP